MATNVDQFLKETKQLLQVESARDRNRAEFEAHRFTVSNYLRKDEIGLSRILGDLLNPSKEHGQGTLFLQILLAQLGITLERMLPDLVEVEFEKTINKQRRLDVYLRIPTEESTFCLAIENKPFAGDSRNQIKDYLGYLDNTHRENFLLLYLSGDGQSPSNWSYGDDRERFKKRFRVVPYCFKPESASKRLESTIEFASCSVVSWIDACLEECKPERLKWFLEDFKFYCEQEFGGQSVMSIESETLRTHLLSSRENFLVAKRVANVWPTIQSEVHEEFLRRLRDKLLQQIQYSALSEFNDIEIGYKYQNKSQTDNRLWMYRKSWAVYKQERLSDSENRTSIRLESTNRVSFRYRVSSPLHRDKMTQNERNRRQVLNEQLGKFPGKDSLKFDIGWWPLIVEFDRTRKNWDSLTYELYSENKIAQGELTDYYVSALLSLAEFAVPIINRAEGCE